MKHIIASQQFNKEFLLKIFRRADELRQNRQPILEGKILASLFYEPSTRTRLSFESAMIRLGGSVIGTECAEQFSSAIKGESLEDSIRVIASYVDVIILRHTKEGSAQLAANISTVPIINAGDGTGQHPTQTLLDAYTIWREREGLANRLDNITIVLGGDLRYGRTVRSLCYVLAKFSGVKIIFCAPKHLRISDDIKTYLTKHDCEFIEEECLENQLPNADIVYMTRLQKERMTLDEYDRAKKALCITQETLQLLKPTARLMHPLPHVEEIALSAKTEREDPRVAYFRQAENGLYIRMALLEYVFQEEHKI